MAKVSLAGVGTESSGLNGGMHFEKRDESDDKTVSKKVRDADGAQRKTSLPCVHGDDPSHTKNAAYVEAKCEGDDDNA